MRSLCTMERETIIQRTLLVDASPRAIWRVLTEPQLTKLYLEGSQARSSWKPGAPVVWVDKTDGQERVRAKGIVMACQTERRLRYTCLLVDSDLPDEPASYTTVDILLEPERDGRTRLELWHGDFAGLPQDVRRAREAGREWVEVLVGIKRTAEEQQDQMAA
ncbi:MAG: SRPBCC domain-containing protein [Flavobacteriales bacterium]|nr:SRPBCC domain-containing protein [Flavobacteriales bacterium]